MVDKNLFLYDLAIVAIMKCEGHYLKEWLDYHLLAGVDHFYIYDNDSPDNQAEVAAPYVDAGLVDYIYAPGKAMQMRTYNDAVNRFRFSCRYMAFIDGDEFVYPKVDRGGVAELVDEIFSAVPNAGELGISWQIFGSSGQETADYSRGVLERFTRRSDNVTDPITMCKFIANPRTISFMDSPHCAFHFEGFVAIKENGEIKPHPPWNIIPPLTDKIVINHYHCKSWEEYEKKHRRGYSADLSPTYYTREQFESHDRNEVFDDGILHYRDERAKTYQPPDKSHADERLLNALMENLSPIFLPNTPPEFFAGKMETFLTCRAVADYLKSRLPDDTLPKFFEESAIRAIIKSCNGMTFADAQLLISELPKILPLDYPAVKDLRGLVLQIIPQMMDAMHLNGRWQDFINLKYINELLKAEE